MIDSAVFTAASRTDTAPTLEILQQQFPASSISGKKSEPIKALFCFCCLILKFSRSSNNNRSQTIPPGCLNNIFVQEI